MDEYLAIVALRADGGVDVVKPTSWALHRLCRNHPDYSREAGEAKLRLSGNSADEVNAAEQPRDLEWEANKVRSNPANSPKRIDGYIVYQTYSNAGLCTYEEAVAAVAMKDCADHIGYKIVPFADVPNKTPAERAYRNALQYDLSHDMPKCRTIHRDRLRLARQPKLDELDRLWNRAMGQRKQTEADEIEAKRQVLRDVTADPAIDNAKTIAELAAVWPQALSE